MEGVAPNTRHGNVRTARKRRSQRAVTSQPHNNRLRNDAELGRTVTGTRRPQSRQNARSAPTAYPGQLANKSQNVGLSHSDLFVLGPLERRDRVFVVFAGARRSIAGIRCLHMADSVGQGPLRDLLDAIALLSSSDAISASQLSRLKALATTVASTPPSADAGDADEVSSTRATVKRSGSSRRVHWGADDSASQRAGGDGGSGDEGEDGRGPRGALELRVGALTMTGIAEAGEGDDSLSVASNTALPGTSSQLRERDRAAAAVAATASTPSSHGHNRAADLFGATQARRGSPDDDASVTPVLGDVAAPSAVGAGRLAMPTWPRSVQGGSVDDGSGSSAAADVTAVTSRSPAASRAVLRPGTSNSTDMDLEGEGEGEGDGVDMDAAEQVVDLVTLAGQVDVGDADVSGDAVFAASTSLPQAPGLFPRPSAAAAAARAKAVAAAASAAGTQQGAADSTGGNTSGADGASDEVGSTAAVMDDDGDDGSDGDAGRGSGVAASARPSRPLTASSTRALPDAARGAAAGHGGGRGGGGGGRQCHRRRGWIPRRVG